MPQDRFWAGLEYFYPTVSTTARFDATATARPGTTISLEDELDLKDRKGLPYLDLGMRLGENWRIEFEYYKLDRTGTKTITRQIDWGDTTFPIGATVSTTFDSTIYRLTGGWSFVKNQQAEVGLGFGLHITDFKTLISGQGTGAADGLWLPDRGTQPNWCRCPRWGCTAPTWPRPSWRCGAASTTCRSTTRTMTAG